MRATPSEARGGLRHGVEEVLATVQHNKGDPVCQRLDQDLVDAPARFLGDTGGLGNRPGDRRRVRNGSQLHEPSTVGEAVQDIEGNLDGQPCLADTPQPHDADDAFLGQQRGKSPPFLGTPDETCPQERQVVNGDADQAQGRKIAAKVRVTDLE